jgi:hypothetical protein
LQARRSIPLRLLPRNYSSAWANYVGHGAKIARRG